MKLKKYLNSQPTKYLNSQPTKIFEEPNNRQKHNTFVDLNVEPANSVLSWLLIRLIKHSHNCWFKDFTLVCYFFAEHLYGFLVDPFAQAVKDDGTDRRLIFTALQETFLTYLKISFFTAFFVTCPFILMQIWKFIAPGLYKHEKHAILPYLILTPVLFFLGGMLVYYLIMPLAIKFFLSFESTGLSTNLPIQLEAKVNEYLSLVMKLIFAFGISFQLPVVLSLLARIGVVDSEFLKKRRKYVVVIIFAAAALLTPPDPITQIGLAIPLLILYELSIFSVKFLEDKKFKDSNA